MEGDSDVKTISLMQNHQSVDSRYRYPTCFFRNTGPNHSPLRTGVKEEPSHKDLLCVCDSWEMMRA